MKRCRDRVCEGYNQRVDDECKCCPICQGELDLVVESENSNINMGNANAVSGGVHSTDDHSKKDSDNVVNSNNETHTNSHNTTNNTTNHTTIYEAEKSASEKLEENRLKYRLECKSLFRDGLISKDGERQLRELQANLNLADELVLPIKEEIRQQSKTRKAQLSLIGLNDIRQTKSIIEQNTAPALQRQLVKLESWMQEYDDNTLKFMYYQMSSMLEPIRYTNRYEDGVKDEYWEVYWAYIAYLLQNREKEANEALASLWRWHSYYPEQNDTILLLTGRLMQNEPMEDIQQGRNRFTAHFTSDLQLLLDAIDELLQMDWAKESIVIRPTHSFYVNTLFRHFVETQKAAGVERLKEWREQERIKREEEERIRLAELERQNRIRGQKSSVLQKLQEIGSIEIACQKAGVEFLTFNVWLEEDYTFASSYNELVHRMEVRKYEEAEKQRKEQELQAETKRKRSLFKALFEQNRCDILKTCDDAGISTCEYQEWLSNDRGFRDSVELIKTKCNTERIKRIIKAFLRIAIIVLIVGAIGTTGYIGWQSKQDKQQNIKNKRDSLAGVIDINLNKLKCNKGSLSDEEFEALLNENSATLSELESFENRNSVLLKNDFKYKKTDSKITAEYTSLRDAFIRNTKDRFGEDEKNNGNKINLLNKIIEYQRSKMYIRID